MAKHTPTPYTIDTVVSDIEDTDIILDYEVKDAGNPVLVATTYNNEDASISKERAQANAIFIVTACNAHADLVKAIEEAIELAGNINFTESYRCRMLARELTEALKKVGN